MSIAQRIYSIKVENIMQTEGKYSFPEFLRLIRKSMGFSRRMVADLIGCSVTKIYYLEYGIYGGRGPDHEFIVTLSNFYGLDGAFMLDKFQKYMKSSDREKRVYKGIKNENSSLGQSDPENAA